MPAVKTYVLDILRWCERLHCVPANNPEMIRDYIDTRWPILTRSHRNKIFEAAVRPSKE